MSFLTELQKIVSQKIDKKNCLTKKFSLEKKNWSNFFLTDWYVSCVSELRSERDAQEAQKWEHWTICENWSRFLK